LAISLDGRLAPPKGGKASIGGKGDRKALEESLAWADAVLIGRTTLVAHESTCIIHDKKLIENRIKLGKSHQPIAIVVSQKKSFPEDLIFFNQPVKRWILSPNYPSKEFDQSNNFEKKLIMRESWELTLKELYEIGLKKIVLLGGTKLISSIIDTDNVDELQLTITPRILGGKHSWIPLENEKLEAHLGRINCWKLEAIKKLEENEILIKYSRIRNDLSQHKQ